MSAIDEGGVWCGTCRQSVLRSADADGCACEPRPRTAVPDATDREMAKEKYRRVGPYYVLGRLDSTLAGTHGGGDGAVSTTLLLAQIAIEDLLGRTEGGPQ